MIRSGHSNSSTCERYRCTRSIHVSQLSNRFSRSCPAARSSATCPSSSSSPSSVFGKRCPSTKIAPPDPGPERQHQHDALITIVDTSAISHLGISRRVSIVQHRTGRLSRWRIRSSALIPIHEACMFVAL